VTAAVSSATGVILAGGQSRRMGQSKAGLAIGGELLVRRVARLLLLAIPEVVVVGPPELSQLAPELAVLPDLHPGIGPLAGIETGLTSVTTELIFVVACDMPFINPELVKAMLRCSQDEPQADVVSLVSRVSSQGAEVDQMEHLHAVYRRSCLPAVTRSIAAGSYAVYQLFTQLRVYRFSQSLASQLDPSGLSTLNANSPEDWVRVLELTSGGSSSS
jgi:molybdopterin-guanine dinucleotide biosynthesis protein A